MRILTCACSLLLASTVMTATCADDQPPASLQQPALRPYPPGQAYAAAQPNSDFDLPQIGKAGADAVTPEQEYEAGVQIINELREAGGIVDDPLLEEYIQNLGHQLSSHSDDPDLRFSYMVLNEDDINAVTLPGGFVLVNSGLFLETDNEDELAGVMAHETGHVTQRHLARQVEDSQNNSWLSIATLIGAILAASRTGDPDVAMGALATAQGELIQRQINYTRGDEAEADRVGLATLARAGFQPQGMVDFFVKMQNSSSLNGFDQIPEFLLDHPLDLTRMADIRDRAQQLHVPPRPQSRSYALMKARLRVFMSDNGKQPLEFFKTAIQSTHDWDQVAMQYGLALAEAKSGHAQDAVPLMQSLATRYDDVIAFRIGLADTEMQAGQPQAAVATYQEALRLFPDSTPVVLSYANDLIELDKPQTSIKLLAAMPLDRQSEPETLRLLAKAYDKAGNSADSHYYMSEYYVVSGLPAAAVDQLRIALTTPGIDSVHRERYQARLHRLEEEARAARQNNNQPGQRPPGSLGLCLDNC